MAFYAPGQIQYKTAGGFAASPSDKPALGKEQLYIIGEISRMCWISVSIHFAEHALILPIPLNFWLCLAT